MLNGGDYKAKFHAYELERSYASDHVGKLAGLLFDAQVEPKPHQIDAALFALQTPFLKGVILADEVGLGKTIEAGIVISQLWAERRRRILIIAPSSLRQQWRQELDEKFAIPSAIVDRDSISEFLAPNAAPQVFICSYEFANSQHNRFTSGWDAVICDEAHRLRSHWTGQTKISRAISSICRTASKSIMLTATPLQNRLEELYGLVSVFEPDFFHSLEAFKSRYVDYAVDIGNDDLAKRVAMIAKRTLRKDADKYIRFTTRMPLTIAFTPSSDEIELYNLINAYLQRPELYAFAKSQRHLSALILRKRLGSSSFAVASTLENTASRLEAELRSGKRRNDAGGFIDDADVTSEIKESDEFNSLTSEDTDEFSKQQAAMWDEVQELRDYAALARSITVNQKAVKLIEALEQGFTKLREIGAPEKAIIFTDSTITQDYLAKTLRETGWGDGLVLFNGANNSPEATGIYKQWLRNNADSDLITGIVTADRRKALVDEFRERGTIMIATEAAAEGINLQFCSMLVNYDLPWNPQRVEQRIGRVHRFGQKHNVIVVNFSNKGNLAEERILELLTEKFQLFTSVFGTSDEVLGQIEDGLAFEKNIVEILERCKTSEEIDAAFNELEQRYAKQISKEMRKTRAKVFDNLDPKVQDKLKSYDEQTSVVLNNFERLLLDVTEHELRDFATFSSGGTRFAVHTSPSDNLPTGNYFFKSSPQKDARQYRYSSELCQWVIDKAKTCATPQAHLTFSLSASDRVTTLARELEGKSGLLTVEQVSFVMNTGDRPIKESYLLMVGRTTTNSALDEEQIRDLFDLQCVSATPETVPTELFTEKLEALLEKQRDDVQERNATYFYQQEELIEAARLDLRSTYDVKARDLQAKANTANKEARKASSQVERLKLTREARKYRRLVEEADDEYRVQRKKLQAESDRYLDQVAASLEAQHTRETLFSIKWSVVP